MRRGEIPMGTSSKSFIVKAGKNPAGEQLELSFTEGGGIRLNATRLNPRRNEDGQPTTKPYRDLFEYIYMLTGKEQVGNDTLDIIKGFRFKPVGQVEVTAYIKGELPKQEAHES